MDDSDPRGVRVKDEPLLPPAIKPFVATPSPRPPLAPSDHHHSGRKRSRSSEEDSSANGGGGGGGGSSSNGGGARGGGSTGEYHTPSRFSGGGGVNAHATPPLAMTPQPSPPAPREPVVYKDTMLSDSEWEREIAEFGRQLDDMLARVTDRQLVAQTAQYMRAYPHHSLRFQIKIKQRALTESPRQAQVKLMLFYLFHEFLKLFDGDELRQIQRDWYLTIDEVLHACMRDMRNNPDMKKRVFKTVARWEELGIYPQKTKQWKALSAGDAKPRRTLVRLPRTEAERLAEAPDQLQQFPPPPVSQTLMQVNRTNYPFVFERSNFRTAFELKQHWRFSAVAFIEVLARCLGISRDISLTASMFFHRVFDRGIYAKERFKFAAACIFLAAKASSKRMKLIRMVKTMHEILELPLLAGDEEILDMERMQLLYYEIEVLKGVEFDLTTDMPFYYLKGTLDQMPEKFRQDVEEGAHSALVELFWLPLCLSVRPRFLAEAAAYIACRNKDRIFSFSWCREDKDGKVLTEKAAKEILKDYRQLVDWKKDQQRHFDTLVRTSSSAGGGGSWDLQEVFQCQRGGLRIDVTTIQHEMEYTQKGVNESRAVLSTYVEEEGNDRDRDDRRRKTDSSSSSSYSRRRGDDSVRIKTEPRSSSHHDDRGSNRDNYRRDDDRSNGNRERERDRGRDYDRGTERYGDRDRDRDRDRDVDRNRDRDKDRGSDRDRDQERNSVVRSKSDSARDDDRTRVKEETGVSSSRGDREDKDRNREYSRTRDRDRSPRKYESESRSRDYDRDQKRDSYRDRDRGDDNKKRDSRDKEYDSSRDRERSTREYDRDSKYSSSRSRRSRSRSPRESSRGSSKRKDRSSSRSKSRSRERSSRTDDRTDRDRNRERGRDRKERSYSSSRDRSRRDDRSDKRYDDQRDSTKIKEEGRRS